MSSTERKPIFSGGKLLPAKLTDAQTDHLKRMVQYFTRADAGGAFRGLDHEYWDKRLRSLAETHDLVAVQRCSVLLLLDLLERNARVSMRCRAAT